MTMTTEEKPTTDGRGWGIFKIPFRNSHGNASSSAATSPFPSGASSSSSSHHIHNHHHHHHHHHHHGGYNGPHGDGSGQNQHPAPSPSVSSVAKSLLPVKRRLKLDPSEKLYFPCEFCSNLFWFGIVGLFLILSKTSIWFLISLSNFGSICK